MKPSFQRNMWALILNLILILGLFVHGVMACEITGLFSGYGNPFYWFTIPHLVLIPTAILFVAWNYYSLKRFTFILSLVALVCLPATWFFAGSKWPGGDDGPGLAWVFGIGLASIISFVAGVPLLIVARNLRIRDKH